MNLCRFNSAGPMVITAQPRRSQIKDWFPRVSNICSWKISHVFFVYNELANITSVWTNHHDHHFSGGCDFDTGFTTVPLGMSTHSAGHHDLEARGATSCCPQVCTNLPSGERLHSCWKSPFSSWVNQLFLWPFSIAMKNYQRVEDFISSMTSWMAVSPWNIWHSAPADKKTFWRSASVVRSPKSSILVDFPLQTIHFGGTPFFSRSDRIASIKYKTTASSSP